MLIRFGARFALLAGGLYTLANWLPSAQFIEPLNRLTAAMTGALLASLGLETAVSGALVSTGGFSVKIIPECTALFLVPLYSSFVLAYPASSRQRLAGLLFGIPSLVVVNLVRLVVIILIGTKSSALFEYSHVYAGQILMILVVLLASMAWLRFVVTVEPRDTPLGVMVRFIAWSSLPFALWLFLAEGYVYLNLYLVKLLLGRFGYTVAVPEELSLYPHTFNTFHFVAFIALILATKCLERKRKLWGLAAGLAVLAGGHFLFRLHQVLFMDFHVRYAFRPFIALIIINQWILPFVLWLAIVCKEIFRRKGISLCPICGEEKVGLIDHMRAKHGDKAVLPTGSNWASGAGQIDW